MRELAKLIPVPGVGSAISGAFAAASTYGLGIALCEYFGHVLRRQRAGCEDVSQLVSGGVRRRQADDFASLAAAQPREEGRTR